jgi:4-amino-4-deoxy-L-arabinose transferase-like glycosyltransferase
LSGVAQAKINDMVEGPNMTAGETQEIGPPTRRRPGTWLPALILSVGAIALRLLVATRRDGIEVDGIIYLQNARAMLADWRTINVIHPPLYSALLAPFLGLASDPEWEARIVSAVLGGLWVWPTLWLANETTDEDVRWSAGLLVAITPAAVDAGTRVLSEASFGLCLTIFLVLLFRTLRTASRWSAALTGVLGGCATLARPEGMGYLTLVWALLILAPLWFRPAWTRRRVLVRLALVTVCWLAVLFPYALLVKRQLGYWHWSGKAGISVLFAETVGDERQGAWLVPELDANRAPQDVTAYFLARPVATLWRVLVNVHLVDKYVLTGLLGSGGLALVVLGFVHLRFRRPTARPEWLLVLIPLPLTGFLVYLVSARYFVSLVPTLSIVASIGLARFGRPQDAPAGGRLSTRSLLLLFLVLASFLPWIIRPWFREDPNAIERAAGLWLRHTSGPDAAFIGAYPVIEYYAGAKSIALRRQPLDDVIARGRQAGARYLIADNYRPLEAPPEVMLLARRRAAPPTLELVRVFEDGTGRRVLIYRIL